MTKKDKEAVKEILKEYEKTFKDLGDYDKVNKRKEYPLFSGVLAYFPDALMEVAKTSLAGNRQHHKDKPLHWDKNKSTDNADALMRHLADYASGNKIDEDGIPHLNKVCWRALALLQIEKDNEKNTKI